MAAGRNVSPGAALLRSSRMFSMPAPIPAPPGDPSPQARFSPTATISYPTRLSVTTTMSSRADGDWGFKRFFPLKTTTKSSTPLVRVRQVDSMEHITDFQSSSEHTLTLRKFQEMNISLSVPDEDDIARRSSNYASGRSVFEEDSDITAIDPEKAIETESKRWKFKGPWLAGMTEGSFEKYLQETVRTRRPEFRAYLKQVRAEELTRRSREEAKQAGDAEEAAAVTPGDITDAQLTMYLRELRDDRPTLYKLVGRFLDLAPVQAPVEINRDMHASAGLEIMRPLYGSRGPPITHPSAGISYLRTMNYLDNHPIYGPQRNHPPVQSRILKPRVPGAGSFDPAIGVGGFIAATYKGDNKLNHKTFGVQGQTNQFDLTRYGGTKLDSQPYGASVDSTGRIIIGITDPSKESMLVAKNEMATYEEALFGKRQQNNAPANERRTGLRRTTPVFGGRQSYGLENKFEKS
ncbi:hypothetical protein GGR56DRAFT_632741 [Xylariaceae sp. FL0804]|nr:hypothetical protein GGR56DRAFT_632741 [Xylariaceae sp. FL0804]